MQPAFIPQPVEHDPPQEAVPHLSFPLAPVVFRRTLSVWDLHVTLAHYSFRILIYPKHFHES